MKNLKKLSVVLFATLLSFNFTSCIDDGVSDAVDQVYLAQAEFLRAQAALQEAKAQVELAEATRLQALAAYELARAEVQLAYARETDANTAEIIAQTLRANGLSDANVANTNDGKRKSISGYAFFVFGCCIQRPCRVVASS